MPGDAGPAGPPKGRSAVIDRLRREIRTLERHAPAVAASCAAATPWTLGTPDIDARLGPDGLAQASLHEVKPAAGGAPAEAAALAFVLRLARRRLLALAANERPPRPILWCSTDRVRREAGRLYGPGLAALGLDPAALLIVDAARSADALWALEEGLRSGALALAVGVLPGLALTPARRLALAAEEHLTPALLVTDARTPATAATATRWRAETARSARHPFDAQAPGEPRLALTLERCRGRAGADISRVVEWSHETHCFRVACDVADRAHAPPRGADGIAGDRAARRRRAG